MIDAIRQQKYEQQAAMLANRVKKRYRHLHRRFARQQIDVFRLYDWEIPEIRAVVDWYGGHLVVGEYTRTQSTPEWLPMMGNAVAAALKVPTPNVHLKNRVYGKSHGNRYKRINYTNRLIEVSERDLRFWVNPWDYVDTGLFGDHRNTRRMIREMAADKDFLNLFCYTGTFTCYAAKGGARSTVSVDRSQTAIAWAQKNLRLNHINSGNHQVIQSHTIDYLSRAERRSLRFDLAVVDPPSFYTVRTRNQRFDILNDHPDLLRRVVALMRKGGTIIFSTNHQSFTACMDTLPVNHIEEITARTIPEDYSHKRKTIHRCWEIKV